MMKEKELRAAIVAKCRAMNALGLNQGMAGNISARLDEAMLITPSAIPYDEMRPEMIALMPLNGEYGAWSGRFKPSTEWRFHLDIMRGRPDISAIVHSHAPFATALSMLRRPILAAHYMIAAFGGPDVRCTDYAPFGTKELSDLAVAGLAGRNGVLLGNHGMIATGETLDQAMWRAGELETLARMYYLAIAVGKPAILSDDEIMRIVERFKGYGQTTPAPLFAARKKAETKRRAKKAGASKKSGAKKPARPRAKKARAAARKA